MRIQRRTLGKLAAGAAASVAAPAIAQNKPFTIGFTMNLTGPLAPNGKAALLASQIWESDINAKGGLLGRPVSNGGRADPNRRSRRASRNRISPATRRSGCSACSAG